MADQTQRLEIATVRAEVGSNIVYRFANDAANADQIPTQSGDIKNLKQVVLEIQQDAAEKISISTTIYPSVAAGLAATADQGIFLVQSNDADEIYTVWQNQGGTAVNTGKKALSATAIQTALDASNEAAQAAENAADVATSRTARYLAPSATQPTVRDNGLPLEIGDVWFDTVEQTEYRYTDQGWQANESQQAIADIANEDDSSKGAALLGWDGSRVSSQLDLLKCLRDYSALRAYTGTAKRVQITTPGVAGPFVQLATTVTPNGCTIINDGLGRSWKREGVEVVDVRMAEATGDGKTGETAAFSRAVKSSAATVINTISSKNAKTCEVFVSEGEYLLESIVDTDYNDVVYILAAGAKIINPANLNGRVVRQGVRITHQIQGGTGDGATAFSVSSNTGTGDKSPLLNGFSTGKAAANYADSASKIPYRDVAAIYADSSSIAELINSDTVEYTSTGVIVTGLPVEYFTLRLRRGMLIDTKHAQPWTGIIDSFVIDKENNRATFTLVDGWWQYGASAASTPTSGTGLWVNRTTKLFAMNANTFLNSSVNCDMASGYELGTYNNRQDASQLGDMSRHVWGWDSVSGGAYRGQAAYMARGKWLNGYVSRNADRHFVATDANWNSVFAVQSNGSMELGSTVTASSWYQDMHTSGVVNDYDTRILATGGSATAGSGNLSFYAANLLTYGTLRPGLDNSISCGTAAYRFTQFFAATATIGTSDETLKQNIEEIPEVVLDAWSDVEFQQYKFKEAVAEKGEKARIHVGVIAQKVKLAFESRGLDPFAYGILCFDEWQARPEEVRKWDDQYEAIIIEEAVSVTHDAIGDEPPEIEVVKPAVMEYRLVKEAGQEVVMPALEAGSRYGVRYEEALVLESALMRRTTKRLENRIFEIESFLRG